MKAYMKTFVMVFLGMALAIAPFLFAARFWWSGIGSIAVFAVFVSMIATMASGPKAGVGFGSLFAVLGTLAVACSGKPILAAFLVAAVAAGIAACSVYSLASSMLMPAMFVPYLIHQPPETLPGGGRTFAYFAAVAGTLFVAALWGTLFAWLVRRGKDPLPASPPVSPQDALVGGVLAAVVAGTATFVALTWFGSTMWVWMLLTLFVLTKPTRDLNLRKTRDRVLGTMVGVIAATLLALTGLSATGTAIVGVLALTFAMTLKVLSKPYWIYASFMTPAIILFDSSATSATVLAEQRFIFTVLGALTAVLLGAAINQAVRLSHPRLAAQPAGGESG